MSYLQCWELHHFSAVFSLSVFECSFIHIEHLYSASWRKLLKSAPNTSTVR